MISLDSRWLHSVKVCYMHVKMGDLCWLEGIFIQYMKCSAITRKRRMLCLWEIVLREILPVQGFVLNPFQ